MIYERSVQITKHEIREVPLKLGELGHAKNRKPIQKYLKIKNLPHNFAKPESLVNTSNTLTILLQVIFGTS